MLLNGKKFEPGAIRKVLIGRFQLTIKLFKIIKFLIHKAFVSPFSWNQLVQARIQDFEMGGEFL